MTEKQGGLKRRVNLKIGKSLEIQEIVRTKGKKWEKTAVKTGRKGQPGRRISLRGSPKPRAPDGEDYRVYRLSAKEYMGLSAIGLGLCGLTAYVIENIDATIIAQRPKLASYRPQMEENIAEALHLDPSRVSVKATTEEGLGFTGSGEGIASQAITLLTETADYCYDNKIMTEGCPGCSGCGCEQK